MNHIMKRVRSRAARYVDQASASLFLVAAPFALAMAVLAKDGPSPKTLEILKANFGARKEKAEELRSIDTEAVGRAYSEEEGARVTELREELSVIDERVTEQLGEAVRAENIGQGVDSLLGAMLDRDSGEVVDTRSIGERYTQDEAVQAWVKNGARGQSPGVDTEMDFRAVTNVTLGATSGGAMTRPQRLTRIGQDFLDRRVFLLDLIPSIPVSQGAIEYVQDQTPLADLADKAAETAEGAAKPQAGPTLAVVTEPIPTIPVWANLTRQTAADVPQVMGYLDGRLRYSLKRRADKQAIGGDGVSPNINGLINRTGIVAYAPGAAEDRAKSIRHGIRLLEDVESIPEIIVLAPADAELFDLTNYATAGLHATENLDDEKGSGIPRTAWGLTQVRSTAITAGTALLIDPMALTVFDRQQVTSYMTDSHASNFTSNILTLLLECRLGLGLFNPKGVAKITFNGTA